MKRQIILSIILLLFFVNTISLGGVNKNIYYISSSTGNDNNSGTIKEPFKSIYHVEKMKNKEDLIIKLKREDVFFENIHDFKNSIIEPYGKGRAPIICGFKILKDVNSWTHIADGLWKLNLTKDSNFTGYSKKISTTKTKFNDIGCIYDYKNDIIYGHIVGSKSMLKADGDIFTSDKFLNKDINDTTFNNLIFKYNNDPKTLGNLCFSVYENGIYNMDSCTIKNITVVGFARHGMCLLTNCNVDACEIDIIGGSIQTGTKGWVRFGNGIELGPFNHGTVIKNNIISRTYDCGCTIQGHQCNAENIKFTNNKFIFCRQAFEHFVDIKYDYINCIFSENTAYMCGENGFNSGEARDADILSYEPNEKNIHISDNIFYGGNYIFAHKFSNKCWNNTVYVYKGQYLNRYYGDNNFSIINASGNNDINKYRLRSNDNSKIIIIDKGSSLDKSISKDIYKKIGYIRPNLKIEDILK